MLPETKHILYIWMQITCISKHNEESSTNYLPLLPSVTSPLELEVQPQHSAELKGSQAQLPLTELVDPGVPFQPQGPEPFCNLPPGAAASLQPRPWTAAEPSVS